MDALFSLSLGLTMLHTCASATRTILGTSVVVTMVAGLRARASMLTHARAWPTFLCHAPRLLPPPEEQKMRHEASVVLAEGGRAARTLRVLYIRARLSTVRAPGLVLWGAVHLLHPHRYCHTSVSAGIGVCVGVSGFLRQGGAEVASIPSAPVL